MNLEQLALMGIVVFAIMALATSFNALRALKRASGGVGRRPRRLISNAESARATARGVVREVTARHEELVARSRDAGRVVPELEAALAEARDYFVERVEGRHRVLFNEAVDDVVLGGENKCDGSADDKDTSEEDTGEGER